MTDVAPPILVARQLSVGHGKKPNITAISFTLARRESLLIVGPNGSGKSTLLMTLAGLLPPIAGEIESDLPAGAPHPGLSLQPLGLWDHLSARANLAAVLAQRKMPRKDRRTACDAMLERFDLLPLARRRAGRLSSGERQRLSLARAMIHRPALLLLDEPFSHLDPDRAARARTAVQALARENHTALVITTPNPEAFDHETQTVKRLEPCGTGPWRLEDD